MTLSFFAETKNLKKFWKTFTFAQHMAQIPHGHSALLPKKKDSACCNNKAGMEKQKFWPLDPFIHFAGLFLQASRKVLNVSSGENTKNNITNRFTFITPPLKVKKNIRIIFLPLPRLLKNFKRSIRYFQLSSAWKNPAAIRGLH